MSDPNVGQPNTQTTLDNTIQNIKISDEDLNRIKEAVKPKESKPDITPDETNYKEKYEQLVSLQKTTLEKLPKDLATKYKDANYEQLLILADAVNSSKGESALSRDDGETPDKPTEEDAGYIGGKNTKTDKYE